MRRIFSGATVVLMLLVAVWGAGRPATAQDDETDADDLLATISALDDRVCALETQVAELANAAEDDPGEEDAATGAGPTPTADRIAGQRDDDDAASDADAGDAAPSGPVGTRDNPTPLGESAVIGDYTVRVVDVVPDATDLVLAENQFNDPPAAGTQFFLVGLEVTYTGSETGQPGFDLTAQAVGDRAVAYSPFDASCGVVPDDQFAASELFPGGTTQFNVCWAVETSDEASLLMFVEPLFAFDVDPVFFALRDE